MKRLVFVSVLVAACVTLQAESIEEKGKRLIAESLAALGGDAFLAVENRVESGRAYSFYNDQLSGLALAKLYTQNLPKPSSKGFAVRERQVFGKDQDQAVLFTEEGEGFEITYRGAKPLPAERLKRYEDSTFRNIFYILRHRMKEPGMIFESRGSDVLVNIPVEMVDITDADNRVVTVYLHYTTKLPVRQVFYRRDADKVRHEEVNWFEKYRDVGGGVKWPFVQRRERDGEKVFELFADGVKINQTIPPDLFSKPAGDK